MISPRPDMSQNEQPGKGACFKCGKTPGLGAPGRQWACPECIAAAAVTMISREQLLAGWRFETVEVARHTARALFEGRTVAQGVEAGYVSFVSPEAR